MDIKEKAQTCLKNIVFYGPKSRINEIMDFYRFFGIERFINFGPNKNEEDFYVTEHNIHGIKTNYVWFFDPNVKCGRCFVEYGEKRPEDFTGYLDPGQVAIPLPYNKLVCDKPVQLMLFLQTRVSRSKSKFDKLNKRLIENTKRIGEIKGDEKYKYELRCLGEDNRRLKHLTKVAFTKYMAYFRLQELLCDMLKDTFDQVYHEYCAALRKQRHENND